jgi:hypothetical protein
VVCVATDAEGNATTCRFAVTVRGALGTGLQIRAALESLLSRTTDGKDRKRIEKALERLNDALALFVDETHVMPKEGHHVFDKLSEAVKELAKILEDKKSPAPDEEIAPLADRMVQIARLLAVGALRDAAQAGGDPKKLGQYWRDVQRAEAESVAGKYAEAIGRYRQVWQHSAPLFVKLTARRSGSNLQLEILAFPGETYAIDVSTNLVDWTPVTTRTADPEGTMTWDDPGPAPLKARFYRARVAMPP